jgi:hypothetical protein
MRADPTAPSRHDPSNLRPLRPSLPFVEGFARIDDSRRTMLLVIGAVITGILGFAITRAIIGGDDPPSGGATPGMLDDAAPGPDARPGRTSLEEGSAAPAAAAAAGSGSAATDGSGSTGSAGSGSGVTVTVTVTPIEPDPPAKPAAVAPRPVAKPPAKKPPAKKPPPKKPPAKKPVKKKGR